jgi:CRISPR-associated protein Cmr2
MANELVYTIITFAPVQGFIINSRKLRDLYGSSFILSFLACVICDQVLSDEAKKQGYKLIAPYRYKPQDNGVKELENYPPSINLTQGTPNQIVIEGKTPFDKEKAQTAFDEAWKAIVTTCQQEIEKLLPDPKYNYHWGRCWNAQINHTWEFFYAIGEKKGISKFCTFALLRGADSLGLSLSWLTFLQTPLTEARQNLNNEKYKRDWIGINWVGESSTLSGSDAIAWYGMADKINPKTVKMSEIDDEIEKFYQALTEALPDTIIDEKEQLSIPELVKRIVTLKDFPKKLKQLYKSQEFPQIESPESFKEVSRKDKNLWTGWFQGDGDSIKKYLQSLVDQGEDEARVLEKFSKAMIEWGAKLKHKLPKSEDNPNRQQKKLDAEGRIIYAGGDDFLGVLYRNDEPKLTAKECVNWLSQFPDFWQEHKQPITVSIGFVWAAPNVPQRDVLEHSRDAEKSAKQKGRDRIAFRILYNSGQYIEWVCPWWLLNQQRLQEQLELFPSLTCPKTTLLDSYRDREGGQNWTHFYEDVTTLESRHGFYVNPKTKEIEVSVALGLIKIYFGEDYYQLLSNQQIWFNKYEKNEPYKPKITGILGQEIKDSQEEIESCLDHEKDFKESKESKESKISNIFNQWVINLAKVGFQLNKS